jgi:uncharacterized membrane protein YhaH (DUF805 family)
MVRYVLVAATHSGIFLTLLWLYDLAVLLPGLAVQARRLHDTNKSGWWILIGLVPFVGPIVLLVIDCLPGAAWSSLQPCSYPWRQGCSQAA